MAESMRIVQNRLASGIGAVPPVIELCAALLVDNKFDPVLPPRRSVDSTGLESFQELTPAEVATVLGKFIVINTPRSTQFAIIGYCL